MTNAMDNYGVESEKFRWEVPARFNLAEAILTRQQDAALAIWDVSDDFQASRYRFGDVREAAFRLANWMQHVGVEPQERVAIFLSQSVELVVAHLATYLVGAIAVPLFTLFGDDAITYRVNDAGCTLLIADGSDWDRLQALRREWRQVRHVLLTRTTRAQGRDVHPWSEIAQASETWRYRPTRADDPAVIIYTSGTTGSPKGAVHAHRVLLGHLPGVSMPHQHFPQPEDMMWTPADWAWIGGLFDVLLPSLYWGVPVVAHRPRKFDPERAMELMRHFPIKNVFIPPTALRLLRQFTDRPWPGVNLRTLASGGESLGGDLWEWIQRVFGVVPAEFYGQTEANLLVANAPDVFPPALGSMGRAVYGHEVRVITEQGFEASPGEIGEIAVRLPDPVAFLGYWNQPAATRAKTRNGWVHTGDLARRDDRGNFYFVGRSDDVINASGYRMGPAEIEAVILTHPQVALAAVIGKPDPVRGEIVKAFVVPKNWPVDEGAVTQEIQSLVRRRLGAHEYPREVAFVERLPMTVTGKVQRRVLRERETQAGL
jgi:acetyl-CoA synthetase